MAIAWLGHLKFKQLPFSLAIFCSWLLVLPEYFVNISAIRLGCNLYTGAQMAAFRLCSGVVCVALVSSFLLGEELTPRQLMGFGLMMIAMLFIARKSPNS
ncbi:MAG: DMT family protein [Cyanobacteria bacterium SBLK]|nr:DMT family protein [Cyanobacteria bacterium SBLK]